MMICGEPGDACSPRAAQGLLRSGEAVFRIGMSNYVKLIDTIFRLLQMLKESIKSLIFTDGFRLINWLCQSYPTLCGLELFKWIRKKSDSEQQIVRLAMCERSPLIRKKHAKNSYHIWYEIVYKRYEIILISMCGMMTYPFFFISYHPERISYAMHLVSYHMKQFIPSSIHFIP